MKLVNKTKNTQQDVLNKHSQTTDGVSPKWLKVFQGVCSAAVFSLSVGLTSASVVFANEQLTERPLVASGVGFMGEVFQQPDADNDHTDTQSAQQDAQMAVQKVNINLANFEQLVALPGIGKVKANAILTYREQVGTFNAVSDIQNIKGIGSKLFAKLNHLIEI